MSLRTRLLLGIVGANLAAFAVLAVVVMRDVERRDHELREREHAYHALIVQAFMDLFGAFLDKIDFSRDSFAETSREVLNHGFWRSEVVRDAYVKDLFLLPVARDGATPRAEAYFGDFGLNLTGGPDVPTESLRTQHEELVKRAFVDARVMQSGDVLAVPLYRTGGLGGQRRDEVVRALDDALQLLEGMHPAHAEAALGAQDGAAPLPPWWPALHKAAAEFQRSNERARVAVASARELWGAAYLRLAPPRMPPVAEPLTLRDVALAMGGATLAGISFVFLLLHVLVLHPLDRIARGASRIASGDFMRPVPGTGRADEIDHLIDAFNGMQREIGQSREALEQRVASAVERMRATEKQLVLNERLAAMGTLAAGIAHEINNPLGGMINAARTLRRKGPLNAAQDRFLALIEDGLTRIRDVVARVLRFSRRAGTRDDVDLHAVVDDAARFIGHRLAERQARIDVDIAAGLHVRGEMAALGQVFLNLIVNALDALPARGGEIRVVATPDAGSVRVTVTDNGSGMTREQIERAFDHFYTTKETGTGLGLSIVHQIVAEHGGAVTIESQPGTGTAVHVLLPAPGAPGA